MRLIKGYGGFEELMELAAKPHSTQHDVDARFGVFRTQVAAAHQDGDIDALQNALLEIVRRTIRATPPEAAFASRAHMTAQELKAAAADS